MKYKISSYEYPLNEVIEAESIDEAMTKLFASHPIAKESKKHIVIIEGKNICAQRFVADGKIVTADEAEVKTEQDSTKEQTKLQIESNGLPNEVVIKDISMPFGSMVRFMVKWAIASIPASLILTIILLLFFVIIWAVLSPFFVLSVK